MPEVIPTPLLFARDARESRAKYARVARKSDVRSVERKADLELVALFKRHELAWMVTYREDCEESKHV